MPTVDAGAYFFPANLTHYVTKWQVSAASEVRFSVTVLRASVAVTLHPVFDAELAVLTSGVYGDFASEVSIDAPGFYVTEWEPINEDAKFIGDVYVAIVLEALEEFESEELVIGLAEVQIR